MEKDFGLKNDPRYGNTYLRHKINESIKRQRDEVREVKEEQMKAFIHLPVESNRDRVNMLKHYRNKDDNPSE